MAKVTAVIDIGSNSARMVVFEKTSRFGFHMLNETKSKVRISENAYQNGGNLQKYAMQRALDALENFLSIAKSYKARKILCVATSALRDAPNKTVFLQLVRAKLGINIKIISGEKEAFFGGIAVANLLPPQESALSVDIGGGSTEFCSIAQQNTSLPFSLDLGAVRLKELFFDKGDIDGAKAYIQHTLKQLPYKQNIQTLIGIGGSFRSLALAVMKMQNYPLKKIHAYELKAQKLKKLLKHILSADTKELKKLHIKEDRFDVIKPGALILLEIIKQFRVEHIIISGVGVREGVYLSDILRNANYRFPANYNPSVGYLMDTHIYNKKHSNLLAKVTKEIFELTRTDLSLPLKYKTALVIAAKLYPIGGSIHYYSKNKHSYYIIQAVLEYGFSHKETMLIATLNRYAKRKLPSKEHYEKYKELLPQKELLEKLSFILSIAVALLTHKPDRKDFQLSYKKNVLHVETNHSMRVSKEAVEKLDFIQTLRVAFE